MSVSRYSIMQPPEIRLKLQKEVRDTGIDEAFISKLVDTFYAKVRADEVLGPVFENAIGPDWTNHLALMKRFWNTILLRTSEYKGDPMAVHKKIAGIALDQFPIWLNLFDKTLIEIAPSEAARAIIMDKANRIAVGLSRTIVESSENMITVEFISELVERFYGYVRKDPDLGPVFENALGPDWTEHLALMKRFWNTILLKTGEYRRDAMTIHQQVEGISVQQFPIWLRLWDQTLSEIAPSKDVHELIMDRANKIGLRLRSGIAENPESLI